LPHLDVKYRADKFKEGDLAGVADTLLGVVARHFAENPDFVSLEILPQHAVTRNRKDVDLELDSAPDPEGVRERVAAQVAADLTEALVDHLRGLGHRDFDVSAYVRIFAAAPYHYRRS
jgi:phenylpyruvate tautomerase PptA (4-oxalocrotonate tautomerase family)